MSGYPRQSHSGGGGSAGPLRQVSPGKPGVQRPGRALTWRTEGGLPGHGVLPRVQLHRALAAAGADSEAVGNDLPPVSKRGRSGLLASCLPEEGKRDP